MRITGRCFCKKIRYTATIDPKTVTICHCTDCQIMFNGSFEGYAITLKRLLIVGRGEVLHFVPPAERESTQNQRTESQDVLASELEPWISEKA